MFLSEEEAERIITEFLRKKGRATTQEIEREVQKTGKRCADESIKFLMKLKSRGKIKGEVSMEVRGWVWYL
ncbi:MAG: hypothetical protein N3F63_07785 [Thermoplasmata archaeon]|nr:hypothetical protein [Thermoplasmata archaeon]